MDGENGWDEDFGDVVDELFHLSEHDLDKRILLHILVFACRLEKLQRGVLSVALIEMDEQYELADTD